MAVHKITNYGDWTINKLKRAKTQYAETKKAYQKITVIIGAWKGRDANLIAESLNLHKQTIIKYINDFNEGGLDLLLSYKKSPGRHPTLSEQEQEFCREMFQLTPEQVRCGVSVKWNTKIMQDFIYENFGKRMDRSTITRMLKTMGFAFTRPTYVLAKADEEKQVAFEEEFDVLKNDNRK